MHKSNTTFIIVPQNFGGEREVWECRSHAFPLHYTPGYYVWIRCSSLGLVSYDVTFSLAEKRISHYCLQHMPYGTASQALGWDPFVGRRQIFIEPFVFYFLYFTHKKVNNAAQSNTHTL